jgi:hypothetical protein
MSKSPELSSQYQSLVTLVLAREEACRALERGDVEIEYRGWWIEVVDQKRGRDYIFNGCRRDPPLEEVFEEIDMLEGISEEEVKLLAEAWENRRSDSLS